MGSQARVAVKIPLKLHGVAMVHLFPSLRCHIAWEVENCSRHKIRRTNEHSSSKTIQKWIFDARRIGIVENTYSCSSQEWDRKRKCGPMFLPPMTAVK